MRLALGGQRAGLIRVVCFLCNLLEHAKHDFHFHTQLDVGFFWDALLEQRNEDVGLLAVERKLNVEVFVETNLGHGGRPLVVGVHIG